MILCKADTNELYLEGIIGGDWLGEGVIASDVRTALKSIKGKATIRINSPGGSADEGIAIYNELKRHPGGVDTHVEALAASAASVIFLAGDKRVMERGSKLMIHRAWTMALGNRNDMAKMAETLDIYDSQMADLYAEVMGIDSEQVMQLMTDETWYDPESAVASKLATDMASTVKTKKAAAAAWMKHPPQDLFEESAEKKAAVDTVQTFKARKEAEWKLRFAGG